MQSNISVGLRLWPVIALAVDVTADLLVVGDAPSRKVAVAVSAGNLVGSGLHGK